MNSRKLYSPNASLRFWSPFVNREVGLIASMFLCAVSPLLTACPSSPTQAKKPHQGQQGSLAWDPEAADATKAVPVRVATVTRAPYQEYADFFADVDAAQRVVLTTVTGGQVSGKVLEEGTPVKKGMSLCDIDLEENQTKLKIASIEERLAKETFERNATHADKGTISRLELDRSELAFLQARNQRIIMAKNVESARCRAPFDGVILKRHLEAFEELPPGSPTYEVARTDQVKLTVGIPETDFAAYSLGTPVDITSDAFPGLNWHGEISSMSEVVDPNDRTLDVEVLIENPENRLKTGLTVRARVQKYNIESALVLPNAAILTIGSERVVMLAEGNRAQKAVVKVKSVNPTHSLIAEGIEVGQTFITSGQSVVVDGSPIQILGTDSEVGVTR